MSLIINNLSFQYNDLKPILDHITLTIKDNQKVSVIGNNGSGKSTLLKLIAGILAPTSGELVLAYKPYYIPQQIEDECLLISDVLRVNEKINAINNIYSGSVSESDYEIVGEDWDIEDKSKMALEYWNLGKYELTTSIKELSCGERTKVFLAGIQIHKPGLILLDEPTNHLDLESRNLLYEFIENSNSTVIVVSHDITLLNQMNITFELTPKGINKYGGNYNFFIEQKELETNALNASIQAEEKSLKLANKKAQEVKERQEKRCIQGKKQKNELPRALRKLVLNSGENTAARLSDKHNEKIDGIRDKINQLKNRKINSVSLKIDYQNSNIYKGKTLIEAKEINYRYPECDNLWDAPLNLVINSGDRILIKGNNGTGKTTLIKLLTGVLLPSTGELKLSNFKSIYLDQEYSFVSKDMSILEMAELFNDGFLPESELKMRLHRALFPKEKWEDICNLLSGGEKMRLSITCMMLANQAPDVMILDEPTNNIDLSGMNVLVDSLKSYTGTLIVISHDINFIKEIGIDTEIDLNCN